MDLYPSNDATPKKKLKQIAIASESDSDSDDPPDDKEKVSEKV